jgi:hypothetical protein
VIDSAGREVDRNSLVQREQTVRCSCCSMHCHSGLCCPLGCASCCISNGNAGGLLVGMHVSVRRHLASVSLAFASPSHAACLRACLPGAFSWLQVLCECLVYACCISQRLTAADIADLVDLLHRLGLKARAGDGTDLSAQQQAYCVLLSILLALMPLENAVGAGVLPKLRLFEWLNESQDLYPGD